MRPEWPIYLRCTVLGILNFRADVLCQRFQILHAFPNAGSGSLVIFFVEFLEITFQRHNQILYFIEPCHNDLYGFKCVKNALIPLKTRLSAEI